MYMLTHRTQREAEKKSLSNIVFFKYVDNRPVTWNMKMGRPNSVSMIIWKKLTKDLLSVIKGGLIFTATLSIYSYILGIILLLKKQGL